MGSNQGAINTVVRTLAALATLCVLTICVLSGFNIQIPPELNTLTGGLVGALTAMLTKTTPTEPKPPPPNNSDSSVQSV